MRGKVEPMPQMLLWEAEFDIELARFSEAAALINEAKKTGTSDSNGLPERRLAKLFFSVGRFSEAQKLALEGSRWDGRDVAKLKLASAMDLVTLGEIALAKGDYATAISILEKAKGKAKNVSSLDGLEWIKANNDIAIANIGMGLIPAALQAANMALAAAEHEWGADSVPAIDSLDTLGLVQISQSDFNHAEDSLTRSRARRETLYRMDHPKVADSYIHAAFLHTAQGQTSEALDLIQHGLGIEKSLAIVPNGRWALALLAGAEIYAKTGKTDEATTCYASAILVLERELGPNSPRLEIARRRYDELRAR
jgi:tetratricopeptide (TPR) repeat protein